MRTTIDGAGRVVVPKAIRDELSLVAGQELEIRARDGLIEMDVPSVAVRLEERSGVVVAVPEQELPPLTADEVRRALERTRR
jgi:AbrB family looped-hinge helix DNA binding protein